MPQYFLTLPVTSGSFCHPFYQPSLFSPLAPTFSPWYPGLLPFLEASNPPARLSYSTVASQLLPISLPQLQAIRINTHCFRAPSLVHRLAEAPLRCLSRLEEGTNRPRAPRLAVRPSVPALRAFLAARALKTATKSARALAIMLECNYHSLARMSVSVKDESRTRG